MLNLKEVVWGDPIKAEPIKNDLFDEMFGAEMLELTEDNIRDLIRGETLSIVVEAEYTVLIRLRME